MSDDDDDDISINIELIEMVGAGVEAYKILASIDGRMRNIGTATRDDAEHFILKAGGVAISGGAGNARIKVSTADELRTHLRERLSALAVRIPVPNMLSSERYVRYGGTVVRGLHALASDTDNVAAFAVVIARGLAMVLANNMASDEARALFTADFMRKAAEVADAERATTRMKDSLLAVFAPMFEAPDDGEPGEPSDGTPSKH